MTTPPVQYDPEVVTKTQIDPTNGRYGFQFPVGTSKEDKDFFIVQLAEAQRLGKNLEVDGRIKIIDLKALQQSMVAPAQPTVTPPAAPVTPPTPVVAPPVAVAPAPVVAAVPTATVAAVVVPPPVQTEQVK